MILVIIITHSKTIIHLIERLCTRNNNSVVINKCILVKHKNPLHGKNIYHNESQDPARTKTIYIIESNTVLVAANCLLMYQYGLMENLMIKNGQK